MEACIAIGVVPSIAYSATAKIPFDFDEYRLAGGLAGEPVEVVQAKTVDLLVPATAEIIIEGTIPTDIVEPEGPFGEYPGYMGHRTVSPFLEVTCITHRKQPWILNQFTGVTRGFCTAPLEAFSFYRLKKVVPNAVAFHPLYLQAFGAAPAQSAQRPRGLDAASFSDRLDHSARAKALGVDGRIASDDPEDEVRVPFVEQQRDDAPEAVPDDDRRPKAKGAHHRGDIVRLLRRVVRRLRF